MPSAKTAASIGMVAAFLSAMLINDVVLAQNQPTPRSQIDLAPPPDAPPQTDRPQPDQGDRDAGFYRASEIIGSTVKGEGGESLGQIQDLLIDRQNQQIEYFILGEGAAIDAQPDQPRAQSSSLTVVPWSVARPQFAADSRFVMVPFASQRLQQAPTLTWQEIQTGPAVWANDVNRFFGVRAGDRDPRDRRPRDRGLRDREIEIDDDAVVPPGGVRPDGARREVDRPDADRPGGRIEVERDGDVEVKPND